MGFFWLFEDLYVLLNMKSTNVFWLFFTKKEYQLQQKTLWKNQRKKRIFFFLLMWNGEIYELFQKVICIAFFEFKFQNRFIET